MLQVFRWTWLLVCFQKGYSAFSCKNQGPSSSSNKNKIANPSVLEVVNYNYIFTAI